MPTIRVWIWSLFPCFRAQEGNENIPSKLMAAEAAPAHSHCQPHALQTLTFPYYSPALALKCEGGCDHNTPSCDCTVASQQVLSEGTLLQASRAQPHPGLFSAGVWSLPVNRLE